ncbi:MAG: hypothetical protein HWE26_18020 [Alteromonadaceae bacterium]|nr:hypothetical protein [Alteromonadaceae bacterium]
MQYATYLVVVKSNEVVHETALGSGISRIDNKYYLGTIDDWFKHFANEESRSDRVIVDYDPVLSYLTRVVFMPDINISDNPFFYPKHRVRLRHRVYY